MGCEVSDLMLSLSSRTLTEGNERIVQKLTLSQVCKLLLQLILLPSFLKYVELFVYSYFSFRQLTPGMHWQNQFMKACLTGLLNNSTNLLKLGNAVQEDPLVSWISMDLNLSMYCLIPWCYFDYAL